MTSSDFNPAPLFFGSKERDDRFKELMQAKNYASAILFMKEHLPSSIGDFSAWLLDEWGKDPDEVKAFFKMLMADSALTTTLVKNMNVMIGGGTLLLFSAVDVRRWLVTSLTIILSIGDEAQKDDVLRFFSDKKYGSILREATSQLIPVVKREILIQSLIRLGIKHANPELLNAITDKEDILEHKLTPEEEKQSLHLLSLSPSSTAQMMGLMQQFSGFQHSGSRIDLQGGLLVCAAVRNRKKSRYDFNPTVLAEEDVSQYLKTLKQMKPPVRERFVVTGGHWIAGEIQIKEDGQVNVLIIDSVGDKKLHRATENTLQALGQELPKATIYLSVEQRQYDEYSCSVYALDDVRHLYTIENYLGPKYKESGLWGYLQDARSRTDAQDRDRVMKMTVNKTEVTVLRSALPLPFLRTMKHKGLLDLIKAQPEEEQKLPVNKRGKTMEESTKEHAVLTWGGKRIENHRINHQLDKMRKHNAQFFTKTGNDQQVKESMQSFTLDGLKKRVFG